ncbi:hypothetical protein PTKU64_89980 [Paraburkholderia terrae]|uniref:Uncharacterized protein n=1 Tax=Paraburkholderia terrae TaxID=311230 RepID=A0ABN6JZR6_9BURK|nr:hypothetical protein PTKU64_89980 [Paraburkholderia terrae]BDC45626.1 hypothetical protein PTKU15_89230 [Paraburkholderia terrae]
MRIGDLSNIRRLFDRLPWAAMSCSAVVGPLPTSNDFDIYVDTKIGAAVDSINDLYVT